jgi:hypothetical protein
MADSNSLTAERLRELLHYDPKTGFFTWIAKSSPRVCIEPGDRAGYVAQDGYLRIGIDGRYYKGHDLAWFFMCGEPPPFRLDHENRMPTDNRFGNLRQATQSQNCANKISKLAASRTRGTWPVNDKWAAATYKNGRRHYLGRFNTVKEAAMAYDEAAFSHHGEFAILNYPERLPILRGLHRP